MADRRKGKRGRSVDGTFGLPMGSPKRGPSRSVLRSVGAAWKRIGRPARIVFYALLILALLSPYPEILRWMQPGTTALMRQRVHESRADGEALQLRRSWVPLSAMDPLLIRSVLIAEDQRFYQHDGVDWEALGEELHYEGDGAFQWWDLGDWASVAGAVAYYRAHPDDVKGRSTITQQLTKNLYYGTDRSVVRKIRELLVARRLEWALPKDRILELYLNVVELGPGVFGVEAASQGYFGTGAAHLTRAQAASLAATLPHPLTSNPGFHPSRMAWRRDLILRRLNRGEGPT